MSQVKLQAVLQALADYLGHEAEAVEATAEGASEAVSEQVDEAAEALDDAAVAVDEAAVTVAETVAEVEDVDPGTAERVEEGNPLDVAAVPEAVVEAVTPEIVEAAVREGAASDIAPQPDDWLFRRRGGHD